MLTLTKTSATQESSSYFGVVMGYFGLALAAATAGVFAGFYLLPSALVTNQGFLLAMFALTLILVFTSRKWSVSRFGYLFLIIFAGIFGITLVPLLAYATLSGGTLILGKALLATVSMFAGMAIYGITTQRNLMGFGGVLIASLIGMIVVSVITFVLYLFGIQVWSNSMEIIFSGFGILLFAGFTAYDFQRIQKRAIASPIEAAIALFLDFVLLFEYILRFMGGMNRK
ncbi:MAG: Bax inhibitor-1/YccA family protein [Candidatus Gracilibacteria bacterium]|nr:Bax inhibitor-1/YccA family protein [Candidatus Gracilibacteria bacterium]MDD5179010.1 Bax inhibitor-1/YccA family protein [Candidatus Gracilibacteria bacterium]